MRAAHPVAGTTVSAAGRREQGPEYHQTGERERPEAEVSAEGPQRALGATGQVQDEITGNGERGRRQQREEIDHGTPLWVARVVFILLRARPIQEAWMTAASGHC
jgi:hypothetical protein